MKLETICPVCGKVFYQFPSRYRQGVRCCSRKCSGISRRGDKNHNYKGGVTVNHWGYRLINVDGKRVYEHVYIMEQHIGRKLNKGEEVHHINYNKLDNRLENLQLVTIIEHKKLHRDKVTGRFVTKIVNSEVMF